MNNAYNRNTAMQIFATAALYTVSAANNTFDSNITCNVSMNTSCVKHSLSKYNAIKKPYINTKETSKAIELSNIIRTVEKKYDTKIVNKWIPADGILNKVCIFVKLENQDKLELQNSNLELDLYRTLKNTLNRSIFFDMIALMQKPLNNTHLDIAKQFNEFAYELVKNRHKIIGDIKSLEDETLFRRVIYNKYYYALFHKYLAYDDDLSQSTAGGKHTTIINKLRTNDNEEFLSTFIKLQNLRIWADYKPDNHIDININTISNQVWNIIKRSSL